MRPLRLRAAGYRGYTDLDFPLPDGLFSVVGEVVDAPPGILSNGSGKSSLGLAIDLCLFGPELKAMDDYLTHGEETLMLELTFEHNDATYRVRHGYSARTKQGKPTLDLEVLGPDWYAEMDKDGDPVQVQCQPGWEPLTCESIRATQARLIEILGFDRDMFRASSMLLQNARAFPDYKPSERKATIAAGLGLNRWKAANDRVAADITTHEREAATLTAALERADTDLGRLQDVTLDAADAAESVTEAQAAVATAETALEETTARYREADTRAAERRAAEARLDEARSKTAAHDHVRAAAKDAAEQLPELTEKLTHLEQLVARGHELAQANVARASALAEWTQGNAERQRIQSGMDAAAQQEQKLRADIHTATDRARQIREQIATKEQDPDAVCQSCGQHVAGDAKTKAIAELSAAAAALDTKVAEGEALADQLRKAIEEGDEKLSEPVAPAPAALEDVPAEVATASEELGAARERLQQLQARVTAADDPAFTAAETAAKEAVLTAQTALDALPPLDAELVEKIKKEGLEARANLNLARQALEAHQAAKVRADTDLERLRALAETTKASREERDRLNAHLAKLHVLRDAFGRDGVPALIVETIAVPVIETRANEILQAFGISCRVELRTQRESQTGNVSEALDIVLVWDTGAEQEFMFFSGGERSRIDLALRLGLAELLAGGSGSDLLFVDEPSYLDAAGGEALVEVLREANTRVPMVGLISHEAALRDAFDQVIEVVRENGRSRIRGAETEQPAELEEVAA